MIGVKTVPGLGFRLPIAMSKAFTTGVAFWVLSVDQPTILRLNASSTAQQYSLPPGWMLGDVTPTSGSAGCVGMSVKAVDVSNDGTLVWNALFPPTVHVGQAEATVLSDTLVLATLLRADRLSLTQVHDDHRGCGGIQCLVDRCPQ